MSRPTFKKVAKVYEILCLPCLKIYGGGCTDHTQCDKYCNYCTQSGCDFKICPERIDDEELIFEFEESRKTDPEFPCPQSVALAYESMNDMYKRGRILSEVKGLKGLQFLEKVKDILEDPDRPSYSVPTVRRPKTEERSSDISICLDCPDYISRNGNYWCNVHKDMKNKCLTCRNHGHIYYDCAMWISARDTLFSAYDKENMQNDAKKIVINTLTRLHIVQTLKMKGCQHSKNNVSCSNTQIIEKSVDNALSDFETGLY